MKIDSLLRRYLFHNYNLEVLVLIIFTVPVTYLLVGSISVTLYLHFTVLYLFTQKQFKQRKTKHDEVELKRKYWLKYLIENKLRELNYYSYTTGFQISEIL